MKKIISFGLGILLILNTFGFNLILIYQLQEHKTETFEFIDRHPEVIPEEKIVVLSLTKDNPSLINSREIIYEGEMYDIISSVQSGNDITFYCVNDKKDTKLHNSFCSLNEIKDNPVSASGHLAADIIKNLLKNYIPNSNSHPEENLIEQKFSATDYLFLPDVFLSKISPPPEFRS
jgi:hypothetical protein